MGECNVFLISIHFRNPHSVCLIIRAWLPKEVLEVIGRCNRSRIACWSRKCQPYSTVRYCRWKKDCSSKTLYYVVQWSRKNPHNPKTLWYSVIVWYVFCNRYPTVFFHLLGNPSHLVWEATWVGRCLGSIWQEDRHEQRGSRAHPGANALLRGSGRMVCY